MPLDQVDVDNMNTEEKEMTFFEHLEALRWHIIRSLIAVLVIATYLFMQKDFLFKTIVYGPRIPVFYLSPVLLVWGNDVYPAYPF
ncbi:MAG: Sec-independent protein translocase subunit TatC [Candidatus Parvibacillus calidus]|nr:MAG: Sec-independent protein translocase subunit TatC [Candidatus Parvibacillus calidus]